jgi:hypothetical protein
MYCHHPLHQLQSLLPSLSLLLPLLPGRQQLQLYSVGVYLCVYSVQYASTPAVFRAGRKFGGILQYEKIFADRECQTPEAIRMNSPFRSPKCGVVLRTRHIGVMQNIGANTSFPASSCP